MAQQGLGRAHPDAPPPRAQRGAPDAAHGFLTNAQTARVPVPVPRPIHQAEVQRDLAVVFAGAFAAGEKCGVATVEAVVATAGFATGAAMVLSCAGRVIYDGVARNLCSPAPAAGRRRQRSASSAF
jgi:hypothetical protein